MGAHEVLGVFEDTSVTTAGVVQTRVSTNIINLAEVTSRISVGQHAPFLCIRTASDPTDDTDTLSISLQCHEDNSFGAGTPASIEDYTRSWMILAGPIGAELHADVDSRLKTAGAWIYRSPLPFECNEQYLRLIYTMTSAGGRFLFDAWLSDGPPSEFRGSQELFSDVGQP